MKGITNKDMTNDYNKIKKQITDLRMDYDELTDWVSQLHHKLDDHIREHKKHNNFFKKHIDAISVSALVAILLTILALALIALFNLV